MRPWNIRSRVVVLLHVVLLGGACACSSQRENLVSDPAKPPAVDAAISGNPTPPRDAALPASGSDAGSVFTTNAQGQVLCGTKLCQCDDGIDNDGDGLIDGLDPECTGPYDNDEATFATGIHDGSINAKCIDCFFDANASSQDDDCHYNGACLDGHTPSKVGGPTCDSCQPSAQCVNTCEPRTPNGCDCFGCCEVKQKTGSVFVRLADTCSLSKLASTTDCPRCVRSTLCLNDCGPCEPCLGRTIADLDPSCSLDGGAPSFACDNHEPQCDANTACPPDYYCHLGCCLPTVL